MRGRLTSSREFVEDVTAEAGAPCARAFQSLTPVGVEDFFLRYCKAHGGGAKHAMRAAMRLFLKFAACRRWVSRDLADAVPNLHGYRLSGIPRGLDDDMLRRLMESLSHDDTTAARDRAIVLLLREPSVLAR